MSNETNNQPRAGFFVPENSTYLIIYISGVLTLHKVFVAAE